MISCNLYDYIEIACMHSYPVKLQLKSGNELEGVASDTGINDARQECIKLKTDTGEQWVELASLANMRVCVENPHFDFVEFT